MLRSLAYRLLPTHLCRVRTCNAAHRRLQFASIAKPTFLPSQIARCERCAIRLPNAKSGAPRICGRCLADTPHFDTTMTLADYVSPVDGMVMALKFTARLDLALFFGQLLASRSAAHRLSQKTSSSSRCRSRSSAYGSADSINRTT